MSLSSYFWDFVDLTRPYDKYISFGIVLVWLYFRSSMKAKEIKQRHAQETQGQVETDKQLEAVTETEKSKEELVQEPSMLEKWFPKQKPFHPDDIFNNPEDKLTRETTEENTKKKQ